MEMSMTRLNLKLWALITEKGRGLGSSSLIRSGGGMMEASIFIIRFFRARCGFLAMLFMAFGSVAQASSIEHWDMQIGDMRVLSVPDIARVAVGDGHVVNAITTDEKEVIIFAR